MAFPVSPVDGQIYGKYKYNSANTLWESYVDTGKMLQVVTDTFSGNAYNSNSSTNPVSSSGYSLFATSFTPKSATSKILVVTSGVTISEEANNGNICWLGAWHNTTKIGITSGTPNHTIFAGNFMAATQSLNHTCSSWGLSTQTINVRAGVDGGTAYINGQSYVNRESTISLTIMEVEA